jgi:hypothetical protein
VFGNWFEPFVPPRVVIVNRTYTYRQNLYVPYGDVVYERDRYGLRGRHEPISQIELVTVGGSTTNQGYITEGQTWQDVLRSLIGIRVANAGGDGMSSFGHLVAVSEWLHRLPDFSPKYYLHYIGVNDAQLARNPRESDRSGTQSPWLLKIRKRSVIAKTLETLWSWSKGPREAAHGGITAVGEAPMTRVDGDAADIEAFVEAVYKRNLRDLIALHRERGETAILVSQSANPAIIRWTDTGTFVARPFADLDRFALALRMVNVATEAVCREDVTTCRFIDLAGKVHFEAEDFYDLLHSTPAGTRKIGAFLAEQLTFVRVGS